MDAKRRVLELLEDGKAHAKTGTVIERELRMPKGNTNEPTRALISNCILGENYPIGSSTNGYFLVDSEIELHEVVGSLEKRIDGIQRRIEALRKGWHKRSESRKQKLNWPK